MRGVLTAEDAAAVRSSEREPNVAVKNKSSVF